MPRNEGPRGPYLAAFSPHSKDRIAGEIAKQPGCRLRYARLAQKHTQAEASTTLNAELAKVRYSQAFGRARIARIEGGSLGWPRWGQELAIIEAYCTAGGFPKPKPPAPKQAKPRR